MRKFKIKVTYTDGIGLSEIEANDFGHACLRLFKTLKKDNVICFEWLKQVLITSCKDPQMWYSDRIGDTVYISGEEVTLFWSKEPAGMKNIIFKTDCKLVIK